jgi:hypothetical protein
MTIEKGSSRKPGDKTDPSDETQTGSEWKNPNSGTEANPETDFELQWDRYLFAVSLALHPKLFSTTEYDEAVQAASEHLELIPRNKNYADLVKNRLSAMDAWRSVNENHPVHKEKRIGYFVENVAINAYNPAGIMIILKADGQLTQCLPNLDNILTIAAGLIPKSQYFPDPEKLLTAANIAYLNTYGTQIPEKHKLKAVDILFSEKQAAKQETPDKLTRCHALNALNTWVLKHNDKPGRETGGSDDFAAAAVILNLALNPKKAMDVIKSAESVNNIIRYLNELDD